MSLGFIPSASTYEELEDDVREYLESQDTVIKTSTTIDNLDHLVKKDLRIDMRDDHAASTCVI